MGRFYWGEGDDEGTGVHRARDAVVVFATLAVAFAAIGIGMLVIAIEEFPWFWRSLFSLFAPGD